MDLDKLSAPELAALRVRIDRRLKEFDGEGAELAANRFKPGQTVDLLAMAVKQGAVRCRTLEGFPVTLRLAAGAQIVAEAHIVTAKVRKSWTFKRTTFLTGEVLGIRLDAATLRLTPLRLKEQGLLEPDKELAEESGERPTEVFNAIRAAGPRPRFEMELILPGFDFSDPDSDPIGQAVDFHEAGDFAASARVLHRCLETDLRTLDAHAHLGNWLFGEGKRRVFIERAQMNYAAGIAIGDLSFGSAFQGLLPWGFIENRPYLRCLHGLGLSHWVLGNVRGALAVFERMLWLNPNDNQGARFCMTEVQAGKTFFESDV